MSSYFGKLAERLDSCLFYENTVNQECHFRAFMNHFDHNYSVPLNFLKYLHKEIRSSLALNSCISVIYTILIPYFFGHFWASSPGLTAWLIVLTLLNWLIVWPKMILHFRINKIRAIEDDFTSGFQTWTLLKSKVYKCNNRISKFIFCTYVAGMIIIGPCKGSCPNLVWSCAFLLLFFIFRLVVSFVTFNRSFSDCQNIDMLFEYLEGNAPEKINSLKLIELEDLKLDPKLCEQKSCPICYENYGEDCLLKIMECPGKHVFHQKCIDTWLVKSEKCPMCNYSVFYKRGGKGCKL